jgi:hypothetical protein
LTQRDQYQMLRYQRNWNYYRRETSSPDFPELLSAREVERDRVRRDLVTLRKGESLGWCRAYWEGLDIYTFDEP